MQQLSPTLSDPLEDVSVAIEGMTCASCVAHVEKAARSVAGVQDARVNLARGRASIQFDPSQTNPSKIASAISSAGYRAEPRTSTVSAEQETQLAQQQNHEAQAWFFRAMVGTILWLTLELTHWLMQIFAAQMHHEPAQSNWMGWVSLICSTLVLVYVGGSFYRSALTALLHRTSNMDTLISMGASVAWGYSMVYFVGGLTGRWPPPMLHELFFMEASGLLALISLGHWLEARARQFAGSAIRQLLELAPATALRYPPADSADAAQRLSVQPWTERTPREVPISAVAVGDHLLIRPGDRVPIDAVVREGKSSIDESMITGEPLPVERKPGDAVVGGTINLDGRLIVRVAETGSQTALSQIVSLVENAQSSKLPVQRMADQISSVFVPSVLLIALLTGVGWYLWGGHVGWSSAATWAHVARAVTSVLIIACPCALGLAVPATVMVATGMGAKRGILIRDVDALQKAERIDTIVFDKTGTLTQGKPVVQEVITSNAISSDEVLRVAASAGQFSSHPLAKAIVAAARERGLKLANVNGFSNESGAGVTAEFANETVYVGNDDLLRRQGDLTIVGDLPIANGATTVLVGRKRAAEAFERLGTIIIADQVKPDSAAVVASLTRAGFGTLLLTGDNLAAAWKVAKEVGIADVRAQVKPGEKAAVISALMKEGRKVAMVGDGINDAPALAVANMGIAMGGGSDIAREAGHIILLGGNLSGVPAAIRLSRATMRKMRQNLFLAFIYNVIAIPLAAFGLLSPLIAAAAMALSDVTVVTNALSLRREKLDEPANR